VSACARGVRRLVIAVCLLVAGGVLGGVAPVAQADRGRFAGRGRGGGVDARVVGSFAMLARVTVATNVRGEHVGQQLRRTWRIVPAGCNRSVCRVLSLDRERSAGIHDHISLHRLRRGYYTGSGTLYAGLRCRGRIYPHGNEIPYKLTLTVTRVVVVQRTPFAQRIAATYVNPGRLDRTPCPLGLSRDAARYTGATKAPSPPVAAFAETVNPVTVTASFSDESVAGRGGAALVSEAWQFGDPGSGVANTATGRNPAHVFSGPGTYTVSLTVTDANGLSSATTQPVTIPAPPGSTPGQP
jgi:hypothetical protein